MMIGGGGGTFTPAMNGATVGGDQYNRTDGASTGGIGGTPVQNQTLDCIKAAVDDAGVSVDSICSQLGGKFKETEIR